MSLTPITYLQIVEIRHDVSHNMLVTRSDKGEVTLIQFWSLPYLERLTDVVCPLDMIGFIRLVSLYPNYLLSCLVKILANIPR